MDVPIEQEGVWKWSQTGKQFPPLDLNPWSPGEPNNMNEEHCAHVINSVHLLNDIPCSFELPIICEKQN